MVTDATGLMAPMFYGDWCNRFDGITLTCTIATSGAFTMIMCNIILLYWCGGFWLKNRWQCYLIHPIHLTCPPVIFSYSPFLKWSMKGRQFSDLDDIHDAVTAQFTSILEEAFQRCFQDVQHHWNHKQMNNHSRIDMWLNRTNTPNNQQHTWLELSSLYCKCAGLVSTCVMRSFSPACLWEVAA